MKKKKPRHVQIRDLEDQYRLNKKRSCGCESYYNHTCRRCLDLEVIEKRLEKLKL